MKNSIAIAELRTESGANARNVYQPEVLGVNSCERSGNFYRLGIEGEKFDPSGLRHRTQLINSADPIAGGEFTPMTTGRKNGAPHRLLRLPPGIEVNARQVMGGVTLLDALPDGCAALVIFDPQYRSVLDRQKYGNEGSRQKGRAGLPAMAESTIRHFVQETARVLKPTGYLALWVDAYCVGEAVHHRWMRGCGLQRVGLFHWDKTMFGMGARFRLQSEYLVLAQKEPLRAKSTFTDRSFPDTLPESSDRARHPHAKPMGITLRLIKATTRRGELVVDPAAGSYTALDACLISGRTFVGCDLRE